MNEHEPRKHHYIPRFILKNFNDGKKVNYWNIENNKLEKRYIMSVFMIRDMYRDETLNKDNPTQIESKLSVFENEIAPLIAKKILNNDEITLNRCELEKLRIFSTLLSIRSKLRMEQYKNKDFDEFTRKSLIKYQPDENYVELRKKELDFLATCRNYEEIEKSTTIDDTIKLDFKNDLEGYYMTFVDARGGQFILSDIYPTTEIYPSWPANIDMHCLFPLSPTRMLVLNHIMFTTELAGNPIFKKMVSLSNIKGNAIIQPKNKYKNKCVHEADDEFIYKVKKIYAKDVHYINALILNEAKVGFIFKDKNKVLESVVSFNNRNDTKQQFKELEKNLIN